MTGTFGDAGTFGDKGLATPLVVARTAIVLVAALLLQVSLVGDLRIAGASGNLMLLMAIAAGITGGADRGGAVGFASGLSYDLVLPTPFGLSALVYGVVGYVVGSFQRGVFGSMWWLPPLTAAAASAAGVAAYGVIGAVLGEDWLTTHLLTVMVVVAVVNALLSPLAVAAMLWTTGDGPEIGLVARLGGLVRGVTSSVAGRRRQPRSRWASALEVPFGDPGAVR